MSGIVRDDLMAAAARIKGKAVRTPLLRSDLLDQMTGARVFLKAECLQLTGSFKFRGAYNRLSAMPHEERTGGVVAFSSGNHAQGVARAAQMLGMPAVIVMPADAPDLKVERTRRDGAEIVFYDRLSGSREEIAADLATTRGAVLVPSFDDPYIVAGQGTAGLEAGEQLSEMGLEADMAVVCCGGGGLASGIATALPGAHIWLAEPAGYDDAGRSMEAGEIRPVEAPGRTLCDALQTLSISPLTFGILSARGAAGVAATDDEVMRAMRFAFAELKLVVEPGGAAALAALMTGQVPCESKTVLATLSGGNVDPALFAQIVSARG
ncbi:pyridoxal-5'-phosphate-dependent protein [Pacificimonas flava]|uniref:Pyridoxal-5'-phosphate-dependent protein n=2 Tax=Pacificimonas TaxID=1960290 RepID=A0A219B7Q8_9SPHN|nr:MULTISPECIES: threonine/serine dehydratase [Pacificimonas]MBZ6379892.1 threonine/serine dehydratase [Pacificimonas aurantium]OWV34420.1 pyridoxal-5'-phosphate-dependent protein [Pacificimonas flava]